MFYRVKPILTTKHKIINFISNDQCPRIHLFNFICGNLFQIFYITLETTVNTKVDDPANSNNFQREGDIATKVREAKKVVSSVVAVD